MGPYFFSGVWFIIMSILYFAVIVFLIWLVYRFVTAHERMADGLEDIARNLRNRNEDKRL